MNLNCFNYGIFEFFNIKETQRELIEKKDNTDELLKYLQELYDLRRELAKYLGDRVVNPKN